MTVIINVVFTPFIMPLADPRMQFFIEKLINTEAVS